MFEEVFKILRTGKSLELIMASYQLLDELDKVPKHTLSLLQFIGYAQSSNKFFFVDFFFLLLKSFPRLYLSNEQKSLSDTNATPELVVVNEVLIFLFNILDIFGNWYYD